MDTVIQEVAASLVETLAETVNDEEARSIREARDEVTARYGPLFSVEGLHQLDEATMRGFVRFENNRHWGGIHRQIGQLVSDMDALRRALSVLVDPERDLAERYDVATGSIKGLGPAVATAIIHISDPERYGVWNFRTETGLRAAGILPSLPSGATDGEKYAAINNVLIQLSAASGIDLWTLDMLWWYRATKEEAVVAGSLHEAISAVMGSYLQAANARFGKGNSGYESVVRLFENAVAAIRESPAVKQRPELQVSYSVGRGVWAKVPWIAVMDRRHTTTTQHGVYIVYLFRQDMSGVYLALSQGVTLPIKDSGRAKGIEILKARAAEIRAGSQELEAAGFRLDGGIHLTEEPGLGADYEAATAAHQLYERSAVPDEGALMSGLGSLVGAYTRYLTFGVLLPATVTPNETGRTWVIAPGRGGIYWEDWLDRGVISIGWTDLGDLRDYDGKAAIEARLFELDPAGAGRPTNDARACYDFVHEMKPGDRVAVKRGRSELLGWGVVLSDYEYRPDRSEPHERNVEWRRTGVWELPYQLPTKTLTEWTKYSDAVERLWAFMEGSDEPVLVETPYGLDEAMKDLFVPRTQVEEWLELLRAKRNIILQGAPGVGKTFVARRLAYLLIGTKARSRAPMVQFHQSYAYEDFIQGYRPDPESSGFQLVDGAFVRFCRRAQQHPDQTFVYLIDEINRGNLAKVFGELMMLIESDKRGPEWAVPLAYARVGDPAFYVPPNVYLIGMMNTADRSLAMVDYALRRRFAFDTLSPQFESPAFIAHLIDAGVPSAMVDKIRGRMGSLNEVIAKESADLGTGYVIGHSFFCNLPDGATHAAWYERVIRTEVAPLLRGYFFDNEDRAETLIADLLA